MKVKLKGQKIIAAIVVAAMAATIIPKITGNNTVMAATTKNQGNTSLRVSDINDPAKPNSKADPWSGSYVYFGTYDNTPIKFRVLDNDSTTYTESPTLFLDSDKVLFKQMFDGESNEWESSDLNDHLNNVFLSESFTEVEAAAIAESTVSGHPYGDDVPVQDFAKNLFTGYIQLDEDKIFVLDAEEAANNAYGYHKENGENHIKYDLRDTSYSWWLRSASSGDDNCAGDVNYNGKLFDPYVHDDRLGVAPALNIYQESIIFTTKVEDGTDAYKLTLSDSNLTIAVPAGQFVTATETTITVPYAISGDNAGTATRVSILITDGEWDKDGTNIFLYDELVESTASSGTFTLPDECDVSGWGTDYHVYILAENINGERETDYASTPVEIMSQTYTVTYKVVNGTWSDGSTDAVTEMVIKDCSPSKVPTGMIASSGYEGGSWDTDPSKASISADTTFTYTFDVVPTYTVTVQNDGNGKASVDVTSGAKGTEVTLTATPDSGYQFKEWQVVSGGVTITDNKFTIGTLDVTVKAVFEAELTVPAANTYSVIKGADGTWDGKSDYVVEVKSSTDDEHCIDRFMWAAVDGHELKIGEECELAVGSTIVIIKADYLKTLEAGTHNIVVNFTDSSIATKLTINAASAGASVPSTGEIISPTFWIGSSSVAAGMLFAIVLIQKKRKNAQH